MIRTLSPFPSMENRGSVVELMAISGGSLSSPDLSIKRLLPLPLVMLEPDPLSTVEEPQYMYVKTMR